MTEMQRQRGDDRGEPIESSEDEGGDDQDPFPYGIDIDDLSDCSSEDGFCGGSCYDVDDKFQELDEEVVHRLERGDPNVTSLSVGWIRNDDEQDWDAMGRAVGGSTSLQKLRLFDSNPSLNRGVASNRSLTHLHVVNCDLSQAEDDDMFATLGPHLEHNQELRCLTVRGCKGGMDHQAYEATFGIQNTLSLASALSGSYKNSLERIDLGRNNLSDEEMARLLWELRFHSNLTALHLDDNKMGRHASRSLGYLLQSPGTKLAKLFLGNNQINDECILVLTDALKKNSSVRSIALGKKAPIARDNEGEAGLVTTMGWGVFSTFLIEKGSLLEELNIGNTNINDDSAIFLSTGLATLTSLKSLDISSCRSISAVGWHAIIAVWLRNIKSQLEFLNVADNNLDNMIVVGMAVALANVPSLKTLSVSSISRRSVTSDGWKGFFGALPSPQSSLEKLDLACNSIDDDALAVLTEKLPSCSLRSLDLMDNDAITAAGWRLLFADLRRPSSTLELLTLDALGEVMIDLPSALVDNTRLRELCFNTFTRRINSPRAWDPFSNLLCDKSSIDSVYSSNHTIQKVSASYGCLPRKIQRLLAMNQGCSRDAAREKILQVYFGKGHDNLQVFSDMQESVLPHAIAWVCKYDRPAEFSLMHRLVRGVPSLFEVRSDNSKVPGLIKRKLDTLFVRTVTADSKSNAGASLS